MLDKFDIVVISIIVTVVLIIPSIVLYTHYYVKPPTEQQLFDDCIQAHDDHTLIIDNDVDCSKSPILKQEGWKLDGLQGNDGFFSHSYLVYKK